MIQSAQMRGHLQGPHSPHEDTWQLRGPATFFSQLLSDCKISWGKKLTFAASAFAKASLSAVLTVQSLAKALVTPEHTLLIISVALAVGGQDGLV